jgi:hypothetical protein
MVLGRSRPEPDRIGGGFSLHRSRFIEQASAVRATRGFGVDAMAKRKLTGLGLALGAAFGTVVGVMAGHVAVWLAIGVAIGMVLGGSMRGKPADCPECAIVHQEHQAGEHGNKLGAKN